MPANLGYMTALLYNQNNCAQEASVITTNYEVEVGKHLCEMLGYDPEKSMGHLVTGGSIANIEAMWVARNLKYFPLGLQEAVKENPKLAPAQDYPLTLPTGKVSLAKATQWQLLNLDVDVIISLPEGVASMAGVEQSDVMRIMAEHAYEAIGTQEFIRRHQLKTVPCILAGSTHHISFTKAATILGIGKEHLVTVPVDDDARVNINGKQGPKSNFQSFASVLWKNCCKVPSTEHWNTVLHYGQLMALVLTALMFSFLPIHFVVELRKMLEEKCRTRTPVLAVVAIMGTTEESAVDSLTDIFSLRDEMRAKVRWFSYLFRFEKKNNSRVDGSSLKSGAISIANIYAVLKAIMVTGWRGWSSVGRFQ